MLLHLIILHKGGKKRDAKPRCNKKILHSRHCVTTNLQSPLAAEKKGEKAVKMGKNGKKRSHQQNRRDRAYYLEEEEQEYPAALPTEFPEAEEEQEDENPEIEKESQDDLIPSKFSLYQQSVQARNAHCQSLLFFLRTILVVVIYGS